jgi:hypothetical protein
VAARLGGARGKASDVIEQRIRSTHGGPKGQTFSPSILEAMQGKAPRLPREAMRQQGCLSVGGGCLESECLDRERLMWKGPRGGSSQPLKGAENQTIAMRAFLRAQSQHAPSCCSATLCSCMLVCTWEWRPGPARAA